LVTSEDKFVVNWRYSLALLGAIVGLVFNQPLKAQDHPAAADAQTTAGAAVKNVGVVKSIKEKSLVLKTDSGPEVTISVPDSTRIIRLAAGQTDLKSAPAMPFSEIQVGDRMLFRGRSGANGDIEATTIVVMKQADVAQKQQHDREDWQKRGTGGIVSAIDAAAGTFTVSVTPTLRVLVKTTKDTNFLRYSPNSVKFADAQKGTIDQIKTGDQLRARGSRSADGKEITAEEVISGTFRNIAGTITSIDAANNSITVKDILAKKSVVIKFNPDSQMRKLSPQMAQRLAFFLKGGVQAAQGGAPAAGQTSASGAPFAGRGQTGAGPGARPAGGPDFQQMLNRIPSTTLADLQKEDAVMVVATQGTNGTEVTAITLLAGVEPILTASPNGSSAAALFSGWSLGAPSGEGGGPQ
jgi:co-chaperonin GroES (HSP10)